MSFDLLLTVGVLVAVFAALTMDLLSADTVLLGGLVVVVGGVIDLERCARDCAPRLAAVAPFLCCSRLFSLSLLL